MIWWATATVTVGKKVVSGEALYCKSHKTLSRVKAAGKASWRRWGRLRWQQYGVVKSAITMAYSPATLFGFHPETEIS